MASRCDVMSQGQGWEFAHLLRLLRTNERLWANRPDRSGRISNCERIAQVAHDRRATVSDLLRTLMIKERMSESLVFLANRSFDLSLTKNDWFAEKIRIKSYFYVHFSKVCIFIFSSVAVVRISFVGSLVQIPAMTIFLPNLTCST